MWRPTTKGRPSEDRDDEREPREKRSRTEEVLATPQVWADAVDGPEPMSAKATMLSKL